MSASEPPRGLENACAVIEVTGPWGKQHGIAYRIHTRYAATSERLVTGIGPDDPLMLRFPSGDSVARVISTDAEADCAILELKEPYPEGGPLPISASVKSGSMWDAYGFDARKFLALIGGETIEAEGEDPQRGPAIVLRPLHSQPGASGLAGAPVIMGGLLVGHLKSRFGSDSTAGPLFACPIRHVQALLPADVKQSVPQPPQAAYDPAWYVRRTDEEQKALGYLNYAGQPVVLFAPELFGKTWLLRHLVQRFQKQDPQSRVVAINLDLFDQSSWQQGQGLDSFLRELALHIALALGESTENVHREWTTPSATANLDRVMRRLILPKVAGGQSRLLLAIDRADAVLRTPIQNTFFGILRGWAESEEPWSCLRLILSISTTPALLVSTQHQSPFNLTDAVELPDLNNEQIQKLCRLYLLKESQSDLDVLKHWVGGHPYLVRLAMYTAVRQNSSLAKLFEPDHPSGQVFDAFLSRIVQRLRRHPERFEALQRVLAAPNSDLSETEQPLLRAGLLIRNERGEYLPRYELYRRLGNRPSDRQLNKSQGVTPVTIGQVGSAIGGLEPTMPGRESLVPQPSNESRLEPGKQLGPYTIIRELGRGGMGVVYEVRNEQLKRRAALKVLHPQYSRDAELSKRFITEARAANVVHHPSIIDVYEIGQLPSGETYFVMEFLEGESLSERLQKAGKFSLDVTLRLGQQVAAALAAAHRADVVHRDLKPDNIVSVSDSLVQGGKRIKVLDFGLAKVAKRTFDDAVTTDRGALMGTPVYMAPEQCRSSGQVDGKTDVYALGIMLYEFMHGQPPFTAPDPGEILAMHMRDTPTRIEKVVPDLPKDFCNLVHSMLEKEPTARPTMDDVSMALLQLEAQLAEERLPKTGFSQEVKRPNMLYMTVAILVIICMGLVVWSLMVLRHS